jgi:tripartite-type tricarboxylate transporter receptor subunit TctC
MVHPSVNASLSALFLAGACATAAATALADAANGYPSRTIRLAIGSPAGSQTDILARMVGQKLGESWGRPVVIDNRTGAGGALAADTVAKAAADGHSLLFANASFAISAALQPSLPYDTLGDFAGVTQLGFSTGVLVVAPSLGVRSVKDLIALAKAQPGKIIYGTGGAGQASHLNAEKFRLAAGIKVVNVAFKAGAEALVETLGGRTHCTFSGLGPALPFIKDGKLLALAVTTPQRSPSLPDVPAMTEVLRDFGYEGSYGLLAPAKTPRRVLDKLSKEVGRILSMPDTRERMLGMSFAPSASTPDEYQRELRDQIAVLSKLVRDAGLRAQ